MAKAKNPGKLTAKPAGMTVAAAPAVESADFPDALAIINSLAGQRDGIEWNLRVYKVENMGRGVSEKQPFLFEVQLENLPNLETQLADIYPAGGTFRVQVRADNQLIKNIKLEIAPRPGYKPPPPSYLAPIATAPAEPREREADRVEVFFGRMAEMMERSAQQTRDLIASIAKAPAAPTLADQLAMFQQFQAMLPKGAQENSMELFQKGMDFATKIFETRGGGDSGTSWLDVFKEAMGSPVVKDMLGAMMQAAANTQAPQNGQQPANAGAVPYYPQQPGAFPQAGAFVSPQNPQAVQIIDTLCRQAAAGVEPKFVASQVGNNMPPTLMDELEAQDDVTGYLIRQFPQVAMHRDWFNALVAEIWEEEQTAQPSHTMQKPDARPPGPLESQA